MAEDWAGYAADLQRVANADYQRHQKEIAEKRAEIARLTAEVTQLRADLANAGAVMVEALIERLHLCDDEARKIADRISGPIGQPNRCPDGVQVLEDAETIIRAAIRALSTLSPIAAAAGVLLAAGPHGPLAPLYDAVRQYTGALPGSDEEGEIIYGMDEGLRALAEQEKADG